MEGSWTWRRDWRGVVSSCGDEVEEIVDVLLGWDGSSILKWIGGVGFGCGAGEVIDCSVRPRGV